MDEGRKAGAGFVLLSGEMGLTGLFLLWLAKVPVLSVMGLKGWFLGLVAGPALLFSMLLVIRRWPPQSARPDGAGMARWLIGLSPVALAAAFAFSSICEELLFRAGIQTLALDLVASPVLAVLISTAIFAIAHLRSSVAGIFSGILGGLALGSLFALTGGIWAGVLAHAIYNTGFVLAQKRGFQHG